MTSTPAAMYVSEPDNVDSVKSTVDPSPLNACVVATVKSTATVLKLPSFLANSISSRVELKRNIPATPVPGR